MKAPKVTFFDFEIEIDDSLPDDVIEYWYIGQPRDRLLARVEGINVNTQTTSKEAD